MPVQDARADGKERGEDGRERGGGGGGGGGDEGEIHVDFLNETLRKKFPGRPKHILLFVNPGCGNNDGL